jgi:hypothetical protein
MSTKARNLFRVALAVAFLIGAALACCPTPEAKAIEVVINRARWRWDRRC